LCRTVHARVHKRGILHRPVFGQTDFNRGYRRSCDHLRKQKHGLAIRHRVCSGQTEH
jgi:hypothetical protein